MDGSSRKTLLHNNTDLVFWPNGLALDYQTDLLYWIDGKLNVVGCMGLNGGTVYYICFIYPLVQYRRRDNVSLLKHAKTGANKSLSKK